MTPISNALPEAPDCFNGNFDEANRFRHTRQDKGHDLTYKKVRRGHDWKNWVPLLDDVLLTFFALSRLRMH